MSLGASLPPATSTEESSTRTDAHRHTCLHTYHARVDTHAGTGADPWTRTPGCLHNLSMANENLLLYSSPGLRGGQGPSVCDQLWGWGGEEALVSNPSASTLSESLTSA